MSFDAPFWGIQIHENVTMYTKNLQIYPNNCLKKKSEKYDYHFLLNNESELYIQVFFPLISMSVGIKMCQKLKSQEIVT